MKSTIYKVFFLVIVFILSFNIFNVAVKAIEIKPDPLETAISAFRQFKDVDNIKIVVPTVVEIPFGDEFLERSNFIVIDKTINVAEPYFFKKEVLINQVSTSIYTTNSFGSANKMIDNDVLTYTEFTLPESAQGKTQITINSPKQITSSMLTILLDNYVALPTFIEIRANTTEGNKIILANKRMDGRTIYFPKTTASNWTISLTYNQPLRIAELKLIQDNASKSNSQALRFLAQPEHSYRVYFDPDRYASFSVGESANLQIDKDVLKISPVSSKSNPDYKIADVDADGIPDINDNCVSESNPDQADINGNGRGDVCDDFDKDGIINNKDNCINNPNRDQKDDDGDKIGNICDKEESRITEKYKWIPWVGIGFAGVVLVVLFFLTVQSMKKKTDLQ